MKIQHLLTDYEILDIIGRARPNAYFEKQEKTGENMMEKNRNIYKRELLRGTDMSGRDDEYMERMIAEMELLHSLNNILFRL